MSDIGDLETDSAVSAAIQELMRRAEDAPTYEDALPLVAEALTHQLRGALHAGHHRNADRDIDALICAGLDHLLVEAVLAGHLSDLLVERYVEQMRAMMQSGAVTAEDLKRGVLVFDITARKLAEVARAQKQFEYPLSANRARELLFAFARDL